MHRKMNIGVVSATHTDDLGYGVIKGGPKVVNGIADNSRESWQNVLSWVPPVETEIAGFRVFINERRLKVVCEKIGDSRFRLLDVVIGPFNLPLRAQKRRIGSTDWH